MLRGVRCVRGFVEMAEHRRCQLEEIGPPCSIAPTLLEMIVAPNAEREKERVVFSPSSLGSCHRQSVLSGQHDWYLPVEQGYKMIRGTLIHKGFEQEPPIPGTVGVVRELRMSAPISTRYGEQVFKGKADEITLLSIQRIQVDGGENTEQTWENVLHVKITDFKTRTEIGHDLVAPDRKHTYQTNMYGWLVERFLPGWLSDPSLLVDHAKHMQLRESLPLIIDQVVVDELSILYLDMKKTRTFTSRGFLYDRGKMLGDRDAFGRWRRRHPPEYGELELEPIHQFSSEYTESIIRKGIEDQIEAEETLAPPLVGDDARIMCGNCPVLQICYATGKREGYSMEGQEGYVTGKQPEW